MFDPAYNIYMFGIDYSPTLAEQINTPGYEGASIATFYGGFVNGIQVELNGPYTSKVDITYGTIGQFTSVYQLFDPPTWPRTALYTNEPSNIWADVGGIQYGTSSPVPIPSAVWLFGSGLGLLALKTRSRKIPT